MTHTHKMDCNKLYASFIAGGAERLYQLTSPATGLRFMNPCIIKFALKNESVRENVTWQKIINTLDSV